MRCFELPEVIRFQVTVPKGASVEEDALEATIVELGGEFRGKSKTLEEAYNGSVPFEKFVTLEQTDVNGVRPKYMALNLND